MNRFTVEETNLLSIYHEGSKAQLTENINATLPYMDADMRELAKRALSKVDALTEEEFAELALYAFPYGFLCIVCAEGFKTGKAFLSGSAAGHIFSRLYLIARSLQPL